MSSGFGTQQNDSRDEPTYAESFELRTICPTNSTETDPEAPLLQRGDSTDIDNHGGSGCDAYMQYQRSLVARSPSYKKSLDRLSLLSTRSSEDDDDDEMQETVKKLSHSDIAKHTQQYVQQQQPPNSPYRCDENSIFQMVRLTPNHRRTARDLPLVASDHSINTLSNEQDELMTRQSNLRDELLNCEKKELFQFLSDDFDTSNNYFSDTVGYGSAMMDPDTDSLVLDNKLKDDPAIFSPPRKTSSSSIRSNFSYISNSIFAALEQRRGGSISESIDRMLTRSVSNSKVGADIDDREPLVSDSEFENIIASFEKELNEIKKSTPSLNRKLSISSDERSENRSASNNDASTVRPPLVVAAVHKRTNSGGGLRSPRNHQYEQLPSSKTTTTTTRRANTIGGCVPGVGGSNRESVKLKRRSLEKQSNIDDGFSVSNEIRKICDHMNAPFAAMDSGRQLMVMGSSTTPTSNGAVVVAAPSVSPNLRRKSDFHSSFDRIKRTSLIERVDEAADEDQLHSGGVSSAVAQLTTASSTLPTRVVSEKLPRKYLSTDLKLDSISLKSTGSYENLLCHREQKHHQQQRIQFKDTKEEQDAAGDGAGGQQSTDDPKSPCKSPKKGTVFIYVYSVVDELNNLNY